LAFGASKYLGSWRFSEKTHRPLLGFLASSLDLRDFAVPADPGSFFHPADRDASPRLQPTVRVVLWKEPLPERLSRRRFSLSAGKTILAESHKASSGIVPTDKAGLVPEGPLDQQAFVDTTPHSASLLGTPQSIKHVTWPAFDVPNPANTRVEHFVANRE
jgi:hypothetical protein